MSLFDPIVPENPTAIGKVILNVYSAPAEEGGLEYGGRVGFAILDPSGQVIDQRWGNLQANDLTQEQRQTLRALIDDIRTQAQGVLP